MYTLYILKSCNTNCESFHYLHQVVKTITPHPLLKCRIPLILILLLCVVMVYDTLHVKYLHQPELYIYNSFL